MLYVLYKANHHVLTYRGGQDPIVHLEGDLYQTIAWADQEQRQWAFTKANAGGIYSDFYSSVEYLNEINWLHVSNNSWSQPEVKEAKQSEFLVHNWFPWELIVKIGVKTQAVGDGVRLAQANARHQPPVEIRPDWYY